MNKTKEVIVLDPKRSNAINIGMTKLPPPRSIKAAILKMDPTVINREGIEVMFVKEKISQQQYYLCVYFTFNITLTYRNS